MIQRLLEVARTLAHPLNISDGNLKDDERFRNVKGVAIRPDDRPVYASDEDLPWQTFVVEDAYGDKKPILFLPLEAISGLNGESS